MPDPGPGERRRRTSSSRRARRVPGESGAASRPRAARRDLAAAGQPHRKGRRVPAGVALHAQGDGGGRGRRRHHLPRLPHPDRRLRLLAEAQVAEPALVPRGPGGPGGPLHLHHRPAAPRPAHQGLVLGGHLAAGGQRHLVGGARRPGRRVRRRSSACWPPRAATRRRRSVG